MSFNAANESLNAIALWRAELNQLQQDLRDKKAIEARAMDLYRNDDYIRGLVEKMVDTVVGSKVVLQSTPDHKFLGVSLEDAQEWAKKVESEFHNYADSVENWISADRSMTFTQMCRQAERSKILTGEMFASREWRASPLGYNTCFNIISSSRVKTPNDNNTAWFGIELNRYSEAKAYHIEKAETQDDNRTFGQRNTQRVTKRNKYGWLQLIHIYEPFLPEYPRGISRLACVLKKAKQLGRYHDADLEKAIITTSFVFAITSDEDADSVARMLSGEGSGSTNLDVYGMDGSLSSATKAKCDAELQKLIQGRYTEIQGSKTIHLFKGEDIKTVAPPNTIVSSEEFAKGHARGIANGAGISYEFGAGDFKGVNFSGAQLSLGIYEHSANIERQLYTHKFATLVFRSWLDEAISKGKIKQLGDKDYWKNRDRYAKCSWSGAKRVHLDAVKAAKSNQLNLKNSTDSRTDIVNRDGGDIEAIVQNRSNEAELHIKAIKASLKNQGQKLSNDEIKQITIDYIVGSEVETPEPHETENEQLMSKE